MRTNRTTMTRTTTRAQRTGRYRIRNRRVRWPALLAGLTLTATLMTAPSGATPPEPPEESWISRYLPREKPDISFPGVDITSAFIGAGAFTATRSGTSMAAPHAAAVAALLLEQDPNRTPQDVKTLMTETALKTANTGDSWNEVYGHGLGNACRALGLSTCAVPIEPPEPFEPSAGTSGSRASTTKTSPGTVPHPPRGTSSGTRLSVSPRPTTGSTWTPSRPPPATASDKVDSRVQKEIASGAEAVQVIVETTGDPGPVAADAELLGVEVTWTYSIIDAFAGLAPADAIEILAADPAVEHIHTDQPVAPVTDVSHRAIEADKAWDAGDAGFRGKGVTVAVLDTGIDQLHPFFEGAIVSCVSVIAGGIAPGCSDTNGHGSHVAGTVASRDLEFPGIAPEASLAAVRVLHGGVGLTSDEIAGMEWVQENKDSVDPPIRVANLSLGPPAPGCGSPFNPSAQAADNLVDSGVFVAVAAGNAGHDTCTIDGAAAGNRVATIAAVDDMETVPQEDDVIASFSSGGGVVGHAAVVDDALGMSPDGATVYIAAWSLPQSNWAVIAYDAATGEQQWIARDRPGLPMDLVVSPDGATVYVTGPDQRHGERRCQSALDFVSRAISRRLTGCTAKPPANMNLQTVAFDAATGEERWVAIHEPAVPAELNILDGSMKISPDGSTVYVTTNASEGRPCGHPRDPCFDRITIAYDAETGEERWFKRFWHTEDNPDQGLGLDIHPDGSAVYVTGVSRNAGCDEEGCRRDDYTTVAYDPATGEELWVAVLEGTESNFQPGMLGGHVRVSPDGSTVYVTGISDASGLLQEGCRRSHAPLDEYSTAAYDTATGEELWLARFHGEGSCDNNPRGLTVSPDNATVYVTGQTGIENWNFGTIAYDAATGEELWVAVFADGPNGTAEGWPTDLQLSPDGSTLYITGRSWEGPSCGGCTQYDYATIAYDTATGQQQWAVRFDGAGGGAQGDIPEALEVSPDGASVYVTGKSRNLQGHNQALTIAYPVGDGASPPPTPSTSPTPTPSESPAPATTELSFTARSQTSGQYSDETLFEARLTDANGDPLAGRELSFELVGTESRTFNATTNEDGVAAVTPKLEEKPGPHWLTVRFSGDDEHAGDADTMSFVVDKEDSALELSETKGKDKALVAHLYDADTYADGIAGRTIDFYAGAELMASATTDEDGVATFEPPKQKGKKKAYEARFEGDDFYLAASDNEGKGGSGGNGGGNGGGGAEASYAGKVLLM